MDAKDFEDYLKNRYYKEIDWYDKKAALNHWTYQIIQFALIVLSAIMPVLILLGEKLLPWALSVSVFLTIGTATLKVFKFYENWINYRTTSETLRKEFFYYKARINDYENMDDPEAVFVNRVEALISREHGLWLMAQKQKERPRASNPS